MLYLMSYKIQTYVAVFHVMSASGLSSLVAYFQIILYKYNMAEIASL